MSQFNEEGQSGQQQKKLSNNLPIWGNDRTMNLNPLILTNIQSSHYFKVNLYELKTYHEVIDEIYYKVTHLEPWEKGSRKTAGQTGMCGGVRGVGAGGIVSTAYCLLYKLFTLKLTRKQLNGLITHCDSPYIRGLGFMYVRYTQPPQYLFDWFEPYLEDEEEIDVKAGGGQVITIGQMIRQWLVKLEWFSTLFPRIPVPIQTKIDEQLRLKFPVVNHSNIRQLDRDHDRDQSSGRDWNQRDRGQSRSRDNKNSYRDRSPRRRSKSRDREHRRNY